MKKERKISIKSMVLVGMFAAVLSVLSIIQIPMPSGVPITLQTFAVALCGLVLGKRLGTMSTVIYVLIGAVGIPVYAGMQGGLGALTGLTGGFLFGFIIMAFLCGVAITQKNIVLSSIWCILGLISCHLLGVLQFSFITKTPFLQSVMLVSIPYIIKDLISIAGAYVSAIAIRSALNSAHILEYKQA